MSWNAKDDLRDCLASLPQGTDSFDAVEVVVVDNASSDGSPQMVEAEFPDVLLLKSPINEGFGAGNNRALMHLTAPYALLINSDATVYAGDIDRLLAFADATPQAGIIGPKVLNPDGTIQYSCRRFPTFAAGLFRNVYLGRLFPNNKPAADYLMQDFDHNETRDVDWLSGCAMLVRNEFIEQVGVFDAETFFMYCEDMDWCLRAHQADWRVIYYPDASVTHAIGHSSSKAASQMIVAHHRSMWRMYRKHRAFFEREIAPALRPLVPLGLFLRMIVRLLRRALVNPLFYPLLRVLGNRNAGREEPHGKK